MHNLNKIGLFLFVIVFNNVLAQSTLEFDGQLQLQGTLGLDTEKVYFTGGRYLPELTYRSDLDSVRSITLQTAANLSSTKLFETNSTNANPLQSSFAPYRAWIRYINKEWEFRLGLQKIDFGSAILLRPLQWFNQIDPRDPLALTNGVYGLLVRRYFKNNSNIWLWGLYGNEKLRGFDAFTTVKQKPEFGGRFQTIIPKGEMALSFHYRDAKINLSQSFTPFLESQEYRVGLDFKWDLGVGIWLESTLIKRQQNFGVFNHQYFLTLGTDYTFPIGNGINLIAEHLVSGYGQANPFQEQPIHFTAFSSNYPLSFFNSLSMIYYHQWSSDQSSFLLNYQHQFKNITSYFIAYYNPKSFQGFQQNDILNTFSGPGIQLLFVYNH